MVHFNFPKASSLFWKLKIWEIYCCQQFVQIQEYIRFKHRSLTDPPCCRTDTSAFVKIMLLPLTDKIDGLSPVYPTSFFSKTFIKICMDATYSSNRLDLQSYYSFISNNSYIYIIKLKIHVDWESKQIILLVIWQFIIIVLFSIRFVLEYLIQHINKDKAG